MIKYIIAVTISGALCSNAFGFGIGGGKAGKKFNYEACAQIIEGVTKVNDLGRILEGKPTTTGKSGTLFFSKFYFEKSGGLSLGKLGIGGRGGKANSYLCMVTHNRDGIVTNVDMQKHESGSSGISK